jgi:hypothetical protein
MGVEYVDIPGFDDPSEDILKGAEAYIKLAHAFIVVIDVAPYATGSLSIDRQLGTFLAQALLRQTPALIVCNKADKLNQTEQAEVSSYIRQELKRHGVSNPAAVPLFPLSASAANEARLQGHPLPAPYTRFTEVLWDRLWNTDEIGLRRLYRIFEQLRVVSEEVAALISVRQMQEAERVRFRQALSQCEQEQAALLAHCQAACQAGHQHASQLLATARQELQQFLQEQIAQRSVEGELPRKSVLLKELKQPLAHQFHSIVTAVASHVKKLQQETEVALAKSLADLRSAAGLSETAQQLRAQLSLLSGWQVEIEPLQSRNWEHMLGLGSTGALSWLLTAGAVIALGGPAGVAFVIGSLVSAAATWVVDYLTDRSRSPDDLLRDCMLRCDSQLKTLEMKLEQALDEFDRSLMRRVESRMGDFLYDLRERLADIRIPSEDELRLYRELDAEIQRAFSELSAVFALPGVTSI